MKNHRLENRKGERGNVLFLILIAVALFAALSYAVTSSSRSGGGDANQEADLLSSSTLTQYPAGLRTSMLRMQISNRIAPDLLEFNPPGNAGGAADDFADCFTNGAGEQIRCVFHPAGGGATYVQSPADVMADGLQGTWVFNAENEIRGVGVTSATENTPTTDSYEIIAFLPNITRAICLTINDELGINPSDVDIPVETGIDITTQRVNTDGTTTGVAAPVAGGATSTIGSGTDSAVTNVQFLNGQAYGCFEQGGQFIYYHALIEQ